MAASTRFMSALNGLTNISYMDIQLLGQHERLVHYSVRSQTGNKNKVASFKITVDYAKEQINVENPSKQLIFTSYGGLSGAGGKMSVYSALSYFRGPMFTVCENELLDKTEKDSLPQLKMRYHEPKDGFIIQENKNYFVPKSPGIFINQQKKVSSITINFTYESHAELSPLKKALALMASLKLMHYHYLFHLHLMPSDIPHLMPPGTPGEPFSGLKSAKDVFMRPSCIIDEGKINCSDILDGRTLSTLFVVEYDRRNTEQDCVDIFIRDQFGVPQFVAKFDQRSTQMKVYDSKKNIFGIYDGAPRIHSLFGEKKMYLKSKPLCFPDQHPDTKVYEFYSIGTHDLLARFYLMNEWQVVALSMDSELSVHWKALIVAHSAAGALFNLKVWSKTAKPFVSEYLFRRILS